MIVHARLAVGGVTSYAASEDLHTYRALENIIVPECLLKIFIKLITFNLLINTGE